jgi:glycine dehydrogenase subunit 2
VQEDAAYLRQAPHSLPISRPDEVRAAREPVLRWQPANSAAPSSATAS